MADQVPQPAPACGLRAVHRRPDAGRAEPEQRLAGVAVVPRHEGDGRDGGKLTYEPGDRGELIAAAGVDREDERVHPLPPGRPQRVPERAGVDRRKTAVARRIEAGTLGQGQDGADGHHAGETLAWTHQPRLKRRRHRARTPRAGSAPPQPPPRPARTTTPAASPRCSNALAPSPPGNRRSASSSWGSTWRNCKR